MKQTPITPPISDCYCGEKAVLVDWFETDQWLVMCDKNHALTRPCGTQNRAVCRWNNRTAERKKNESL